MHGVHAGLETGPHLSSFSMVERDQDVGPPDSTSRMCPNQCLYMLEQHVSRASTRAGPRSCLLHPHMCSATMMHGMLSMGLRGLQACCLIMMTWCSASLSCGSTCAGLQEKARIKAERDAAEAKYKTALVDGRQEQVCHADGVSEPDLHCLRWRFSWSLELYKAPTWATRQHGMREPFALHTGQRICHKLHVRADGAA